MTYAIVVFTFSFIIARLGYVWYRNRSRKFGKNFKTNLPPCLPRLPIIGSLHKITDLKKMHFFFLNKSKEMGDTIGFYIGNKYMVILNGRQTIYEAFVKNSEIFSSRETVHFAATGFNPECFGIFAHVYDEDFIQYHKICLNILKEFAFNRGIMETKITMEVENLVQKLKIKNDQALDTRHDITVSVSNVIGSIMFGKCWSADDPKFHVIIDIMNSFVRESTDIQITNFFPILKYLPFLRKHFKLISKTIERWHVFIDNILQTQWNANNLTSFVTVYLEEIQKMKNSKELSLSDMTQLKYTVSDIFMAGLESTSVSIQWFIYLMANHQDIQKKLRDQIDRVVGQERFPSMQDKTNLPLLEAAIQELLRLKTFAPLGFPHKTTEDSIINGFLIPKNTIVMSNIYAAHMDPDVWDEPEKFKIERFLNDDGTVVVNKKNIIPFSIGKRSCMGEVLARQELFLFASALIQQFEILPPEGMDKVVAEEITNITMFPTAFETRFLKRF